MAMRWLFTRWWAWALVAMTALLLVAMALFASGGSKITEANCDRIVAGMTLEEVEALLGRPPSASSDDGFMQFWCAWTDENDNKIVAFDSRRQVLWCVFTQGQVSLQERLR